MENKEQDIAVRLEAATTLLERTLSWLEERQGILSGEVERISATVEQSRREAELADARVEDMRAEVWKLTRVTFTGAAILLREKAAYRATSFRMAS